ncbi:MAG: methyltransferase domain-containing protein [Candidatus Sungbacteria bacterium]|nr:methyltransferase domain-containing protein [Candidatus Sungbacteria bacterium]
MPESFKETKTEDKKYESDVDRMLDEVYGYGAVEMFNRIWQEHPEWPLEQALKEYEKNPTGNQTSFFRTGNLWTTAHELVPHIKKKNGERVQILDIGSATGEEAYSLGVLLLEGGTENFQITGVDVTPDAVKTAEAGEYKLWLDSVDRIGNDAIYSHHLTQDYFKKGYFEDTGKRWERKESSYKYTLHEMVEMKKRFITIPDDAFRKVSQIIIGAGKKLRDKISFEEHDILESPVSGEYDVLLMNHVLLHYPQKRCEQILKNALSSLRPGGFLVLDGMRPRENEKEWLGPYSEWREHITENFPLEEVLVKDRYSSEAYSDGQHFRFLGWSHKELPAI